MANNKSTHTAAKTADNRLSLNGITQKLRRIRLLNMVVLTVCGIVYAIGVTIFMAPVKLYDCGMSGTAMLLGQLTPKWMSLSLFLILLNIPVFLYGFKKQGILSTFYAIYAIGIYSLSAWLITDVLPVDVSVASPIAQSDLLLCALCGGVVTGIASGFAIRFGGAMDGIEVLAVIFAKRLGLTVGTFCMIYNVALYIVCGCVIHSWILPLYSIVTYAAAQKTLDYIVDGLDKAKSAMIITTRPDEICSALIGEFECGITRIKAVGGYSGKDKTVIYFVVNRFQAVKMKNIVHEIDNAAFITISEITDVFSAAKD